MIHSIFVTYYVTGAAKALSGLFQSAVLMHENESQIYLTFIKGSINCYASNNKNINGCLIYYSGFCRF